MTKNYVCHIPYLRKHTSYDCDFWYTCVKWWHLQKLFSFFFLFWFCWLLGVGKVKWQKMAQNDKKFCLSHSVSQELYLIWLWFLESKIVYQIKIIKIKISICLFKHFYFLGGVPISICHFFCSSVLCPFVHCAPFPRNCTSYNHNLWYTCVKWWYLQQFFHFFKILIF